MFVGRYGKVPVYGSRPRWEDMVRRAQRDRFDPESLLPALEADLYNRYWLEVWARPVPHMDWLRDPADGQVKQMESTGYLSYRTRRDGKIVCDGYSRPAARYVLNPQLDIPA